MPPGPYVQAPLGVLLQHSPEPLDDIGRVGPVWQQQAGALSATGEARGPPWTRDSPLVLLELHHVGQQLPERRVRHLWWDLWDHGRRGESRNRANKT